MDFTNLGICVDCIKGKHTKHTSKKKATRSTQLNEIIRIDIFEPHEVLFVDKEKYFITFIDDFSRYGYISICYIKKSQLVDVLKVLINKVERQLDRKMKIVKSDRGGEYYEKYTENG